MALLRAGSGAAASLIAAWSGASGGPWTLSAPLPIGTSQVRATSSGAGKAIGVILTGGRGETLAGPGSAWRALPPLPAWAATLTVGPGSQLDALAAHGGTLSDWRLGPRPAGSESAGRGPGGLAADPDGPRHDPLRLVGLAAMSYLTAHWSFDPFLIVAIVVAGWHEIGLARLAPRARPAADPRAAPAVDLGFYAGLVEPLLVTVQSPIDYWSDYYYGVHMIQHLLLMFVAPSLIVAGAPWIPLMQRSARPAHPQGGVRRPPSLLWSAPLRAAGLIPDPALHLRLLLFNVAMVPWYVPALFDLCLSQSDGPHLVDARAASSSGGS